MHFCTSLGPNSALSQPLTSYVAAVKTQRQRVGQSSLCDRTVGEHSGIADGQNCSASREMATEIRRSPALWRRDPAPGFRAGALRIGARSAHMLGHVLGE